MKSKRIGDLSRAEAGAVVTWFDDPTFASVVAPLMLGLEEDEIAGYLHDQKPDHAAAITMLRKVAEIRDAAFAVMEAPEEAQPRNRRTTL